MQRNNLKMCLRTIDSCIDTSEIAKVLQLGWKIMLVQFPYTLIYKRPHIRMFPWGTREQVSSLFGESVLAGIWWWWFPKFQLLYYSYG